LLLGQLAVGVALYRLLLLMLPAGWALLVPLGLFLFTPMTLEVSAWWAVGINLLPMQLAMILAVGAQVRYLRTGERRHLVTLALAVAGGLLFFEKALLIVPLVVLVTLCLYTPGGPVRAMLATVRRWWPSWAVLAAVTAAYLAVYLPLSANSMLRTPASGGEVGTFVQQFYGVSLASWLVGGPWQWLDAADGAPVAASVQPARWVAWALAAALVAGTIWWRRGVAVRAWTLLALFSALAAGLLLFLASSVHSGTGFAADWRVKAGRDYLRTAQAELAEAEPGTVFMDQPVPEAVIPDLSYPWNMQSKFFGPLADGPVFVTGARRLSVFDESGHIRPAWVDGVRAEPGPLPGCGYRVTGGRTARIPLQAAVADYWQALRIGYLSDRDTTAVIRVGDHPAVPFDVHRGLNAMFLLMLAEGDEVVLTVGDPAANLCTDEIQIGALVPQSAG
jgi:hypothetical protein